MLFIFPTLKSFLLCSLLCLKNNTKKSNITVEKYGNIIKCIRIQIVKYGESVQTELIFTEIIELK